MDKSAFHKKLANGGNIVTAEGYVFELERRGYVQAGAFVPDVVLNHPNVVKGLYEEMVHAGSEVVLALTYYAHREKLKLIGKEDQLESINRKALSMAREVARSSGALFAGNICNSTVYQQDNEESHRRVEAMFKEQIEWAVGEGVDFILGETFDELGEAMLALKCIKKYGKGLPAVINFAASGEKTFDGVSFVEACRQVEEAGADMVGLNCCLGPATIIPLMKEVRKVCKGPIACLPVAYRTTPECPTMHSFVDPVTGQNAFPVDLPAHLCSRTDIKRFAEACKEIGVQLVGLCCGNCSHYTRVVAEVYGRTPPSSKFSPDMSKHYQFGDKSKFSSYHTEKQAKWKNTGLDS